VLWALVHHASPSEDVSSQEHYIVLCHSIKNSVNAFNVVAAIAYPGHDVQSGSGR
jgi:hypothetical protein